MNKTITYVGVVIAVVATSAVGYYAVTRWNVLTVETPAVPSAQTAHNNASTRPLPPPNHGDFKGRFEPKPPPPNGGKSN